MKWMLTVVLHSQKTQQDEKWGQSPRAEASFSLLPLPFYNSISNLQGSAVGSDTRGHCVLEARRNQARKGDLVWVRPTDVCIWKCYHQLVVPFWKAVESSESSTLIKVRGHWPGGQKPDPTSYLLCFWVTDVVWPAASHSCCQILPVMINWFLLKSWVTLSP